METKRPTIPAAEEILGGYFPVLDHGFVSLIDYMGSDEAVEQAARVSYGAGTRKVSQTRGLVRYLRRHHHTTPSEMVELKFHCAMPMFVARQWIRHRTACLAEGTEVYFDLPGGVPGSAGAPIAVPIEDVTPDAVSPGRLRQIDEDTREVRHTRVVSVHRNGRRSVFRMTLADGKSVEATADHRFLFEDGWRTLKRATGLERTATGASWRNGDHLLYVDGSGEPAAASHGDRPTDPVALGSSGAGVAIRPVLAPSGPGQARLVRIERFEYVGEKETYDLEVQGPYHNFIANGIVTHNSVNELSARYSLMPLLFYEPKEQHFALQSRSNKQGREGGAPPEVYREAVERWERLRSQASDSYTWLLEQDVAREIARIDLPVSMFTQWYWKIDLHNLLHFLTLRVDERAQWEIREYARVMAAMMRRVAPLTYEAWIDYDLEARRFTRAEREVLARLVEADDAGVRARDGAAADADAMKDAGLSPREIRELAEKLQAPGRQDFDLDLSAMRTAEDVAAEMYEAVPGSFE